MDNEQKLVTWLFETKAVRVCPEDRPFWYTSGTIGPYYINTHFLYGSEEKANELLKIIDSEKSDIFNCPKIIHKITKENYRKDSIYSGLINEMCQFIKNNIDLSQVDFISGGERRDWFFSLLAAEILEKPHIAIFKDLKTVMTSGSGEVHEVSQLKGARVLHIADLITEASSYERAWIPAIKDIGGEIKWSVVVVDRKQGGEELLAKSGIKSFAMINIDKGLFDTALKMGHINEKQHRMLMDYLKNPKESMKSFLHNHPNFLSEALNSDPKTAERARLCLDKNIYGIRI